MILKYAHTWANQFTQTGPHLGVLTFSFLSFVLKGIRIYSQPKFNFFVHSNCNTSFLFFVHLTFTVVSYKQFSCVKVGWFVLHTTTTTTPTTPTNNNNNNTLECALDGKKFPKSIYQNSYLPLTQRPLNPTLLWIWAPSSQRNNLTDD